MRLQFNRFCQLLRYQRIQSFSECWGH